MNKPVAPSGNIFVTVERRFNDTVKTDSGIEFFKDTTFHPEWNTSIEGTVYSVPLKVGSEVGNKGIPPTIKEGDKIYFEYHVLLDPRNSYIIDGKTLWMVSYSSVFARVVDGVIEPAGGKAFVEPEPEPEPEYQGLIIVPDSVKVDRKKPKKDRGIIRFVGPPKNGHEPVLVPIGSRVFFPDFCAHLNKVGDTEYYIMNQEYILAYESI